MTDLQLHASAYYRLIENDASKPNLEAWAEPVTFVDQLSRVRLQHLHFFRSKRGRL
jgi:hypothetical protein